jgi:protein-S-isoprenylcysteine O-methyltransferase Ste14
MKDVILILISVALFGIFHSVLAAYRSKLIAQRAIGHALATSIYRLAFNIMAVLSIAPALYLTFMLPDRELYRFPEPLNILVLIVQAMAGLGVVYAVYQLDFFFFAGLRQLFRANRFALESTSTAHLVTNGLHRYVRHPLYTTSLIFLYLASPMTIHHLTLIVGLTLYFYIGSIFEERKLVHEFGDAYRQYQKQVPRLIPRRSSH